MRIFISLFAFTFLQLSAKICNGQKQEIIFNHVSPPEGSYYGLVGGITQDPKGYMWFGTTAMGLFRYDGYQMINYKNDPVNSTSLANNWIECIYTDSAGIIWLGTWGSGVDRFDPATGIFTHYKHDPKNPSSIAQDLVTTIYEDREGKLWIGTHGGLDLMDRKTGKFTHYRHDQNDPSSLSNDQVRVIYEDKQGSLWVGTGSPWIGAESGGRPGETGVTGEGGLNRMDGKTGKFTRYMNDPKDPHSLAQNKVRAIFEDSRGTFWVGTTGEDGLQIMDREKGTFQRYPYDPLHPEKLSRPPLNKKISFDQISFITEDAAGAVWIGTAGAGINRYDPVTQKIKHYCYGDSAAGYNDNSAWAHYTSRDGTLWISSFASELYRIDLFHTNIPHYNLERNVYSFVEDREGVLWMGTQTGLVQKDKNSGKIRRFVNDPLDTTSLSNNFIYSITKDSSDNLWIGTLGGLDRFNRGTQTFTHYRHDEKNKNSLTSDTVFSVYVDHEQNIWIGTINGLDVIDPRTGNFTTYKNNPEDTNSLSSGGVYGIHEDKRGLIWLGTRDGVNKLDRMARKFKRYSLVILTLYMKIAMVIYGRVVLAYTNMTGFMIAFRV